MHFLLDDVRFLYRYFYGAYDIEVEKHDESHAGRVASRFAFHNTMGMFCGRPRGAHSGQADLRKTDCIAEAFGRRRHLHLGKYGDGRGGGESSSDGGGDSGDSSHGIIWSLLSHFPSFEETTCGEFVGRLEDLEGAEATTFIFQQHCLSTSMVKGLPREFFWTGGGGYTAPLIQPQHEYYQEKKQHDENERKGINFGDTEAAAKLHHSGHAASESRQKATILVGFFCAVNLLFVACGRWGTCKRKGGKRQRFLPCAVLILVLNALLLYGAITVMALLSVGAPISARASSRPPPSTSPSPPPPPPHSPSVLELSSSSNTSFEAPRVLATLAAFHFDRTFVICCDDKDRRGNTEPNGNGCARHRSGGGFWPWQAQRRVMVLDCATVDKAHAPALKFILNHPPEERGRHKVATLLHHLSAVARAVGAAEVQEGIFGTDLPLVVNQVLIVEADLTALRGSRAHWWGAPGEVKDEVITIKNDDGRNFTSSAALAAADIADALASKPWEVVRFIGSFVHAIRGKQELSMMSNNTSNEERCYEPCLCRERRRRKRSSTSTSNGGIMRLCDVKGSFSQSDRDWRESRIMDEKRPFCDVRDAAAYGLSASAIPKLLALYKSLLANSSWAQGSPPREVPWIDTLLPSHFQNVYAFPMLGVQSHKSNYRFGRRPREAFTPWHSEFKETCLVRA
jgi:hypothetical protein